MFAMFLMTVDVSNGFNLRSFVAIHMDIFESYLERPEIYARIFFPYVTAFQIGNLHEH
jgi:hypothetical protein